MTIDTRVGTAHFKGRSNAQPVYYGDTYASLASMHGAKVDVVLDDDGEEITDTCEECGCILPETEAEWLYGLPFCPACANSDEFRAQQRGEQLEEARIGSRMEDMMERRMA